MSAPLEEILVVVGLVWLWAAVLWFLTLTPRVELRPSEDLRARVARYSMRGDNNGAE